MRDKPVESDERPPTGVEESWFSEDDPDTLFTADWSLYVEPQEDGQKT